MCGQVEGDGESLLTRGEVTAIEGIRLLGGGESGILTDGPRAERIHHRVRTTEVRGNTGCEVEVLHTLQVFFRINRTNLNMLRGLPVFYNTILFNPLGTIFLYNAVVDIDISKIFSHFSLVL